MYHCLNRETPSRNCFISTPDKCKNPIILSRWRFAFKEVNNWVLDIKKNYFGKVKILVAVLFCVISVEIWNNVVECPITGRKKFLPLSDEQMEKYYKEFDDINDADYEEKLSEMLGEPCKIIGIFHYYLSMVLYFFLDNLENDKL